MIWVCRTGKNSVYVEYFLSTSRIYLPWDGFKVDISTFNSMDTLKILVKNEKNNNNRTSISNWAGQLKTFCIDMQENDVVLLPHPHSSAFSVGIITGKYEFNPNGEKDLYHSRGIKVLKGKLKMNDFSQSMQYTLRAYRTIFRVKNETEIIESIKINCEEVTAWMPTR